MQLLIFTTLVCSTATAGIFPPDSTELELPDLSDLQTPPSLSTIVPDSNLIYNGLSLPQFDSTNNVLTLPDFSGQDNDLSSSNLIDPDEPSSISIASVDLGELAIQTYSSDIAKPSNSNSDEVPLIATPNPDSGEISSTDPLLINSIALTGSRVSGRRCRPGNVASVKGVELSQECIDLSTFIQYNANSNTADQQQYSDEEVTQNNGLSERDGKWETRQEDEGFDSAWDEDSLHRCDHVGSRWIPFCCMGPYEWVKFDQRLKPRQKEKRYP